MNYLLAATAFAVLMIVFSTAVTGLTESYLRLASIRAKVLAHAVLQFLKEDPTLQRFAEQKLDEADALAKLTLNQASLGARLGWVHGIGRFFHSIFTTKSGKEGGERVETLSTYSFLQRLAKTDIGRKIAEAGEEAALRSITMNFERFQAASNELFRKHAQATTMVLSILFAFALNINAERLFRHLVQNPSLSTALIEDGKTAAEDNKDAVERLDALIVEIGKRSNTSEETKDALDSFKTTLDQTKSDAEKTLKELSALQTDYKLPIGWTEYPYRAQENPPSPLYFARWFFGTLLAGFLIGLGGPFWYRAFSSLSALLQAVRSIQGSARQEAIEKDKPKEQPSSQKLIAAVTGGKDVPEGDFMRIFRAATGLDSSNWGDIIPEPKPTTVVDSGGDRAGKNTDAIPT